jgi:peptide deformylase
MKIEIIKERQTPRLKEISDDDIYGLVHYGLPVLSEFLAFAKSQENAVGLAGNQVSMNGERYERRVFALKDLKTKEWSLILNPIITEYIGMKELKEEGCLTWPHKIIVAERYRAVRVSYFNMRKEKCEGFFKGFEAQIWQHEINHLNGVEEQIEDQFFVLPKGLDPGRNELCPCNSGKKYKKCCLNLL